MSASGYITLPDGKDWYARWTGYDLVLKTIADKLQDVGDEGYFKKWLYFIIPDENARDIECYMMFLRKIGDEYEDIWRKIDTRLMKDKYQIIFWKTVEQLQGELDPNPPGPGYLIHTLYEEYKNSLQNEYKAPRGNSDDKDNFLIGGFEICEP